LTLIKSISGIRGIIGGRPGNGLTPIDIVKYTSAFGTLMAKGKENPSIVIGRDARVSGEMVSGLVATTLQALGIEVIDLGLSTTPTVEMAVVMEKASGGIILTASHNPAQWNALKLLNERGEFISAAVGEAVLSMAETSDFEFAEVPKLGKINRKEGYIAKHIESILALPLVKKDLIKSAGFRIAVDAVNSSGGIAVPMLLEALGVRQISKYFCEPDGHFPHNPEPLPENLGFISSEIKRGKFDLGIVVDPDVDRLALICEDGSMFGEEYTLVAVADYVLKHTPGNTVSNLSSTRALQDITEKYGKSYFASAVGEVNVVEMMKLQQAIIGGEGNGGIIYPELHYGRDALVGIALFLSHLAESGKSASLLRASLPPYFISKQKIELTPEVNLNTLLEGVRKRYDKNPINTIDGVKISFDKSWVHLRRSNTEPIIRIYAEADTMAKADTLANKIISDLKELL
jgi:phosphomannomutase